MPRPNRPRNTGGERLVISHVLQLRDKAGWSNSELARRLEQAECPIALSALYKLEKGERKLTVDEVFGFARVFDRSPVDLVRAATNTGTLPREATWKVKLLEDLFHKADHLRDQRTEVTMRLAEIDVQLAEIDEKRRQHMVGLRGDLVTPDYSDETWEQFRDWIRTHFSDWDEFLTWSGIAEEIEPRAGRSTK